jgi:predicted translin family RNA/ssDNA-binding protein
LRFGALSNSLEEWAEGYLCYVWCTEKKLVSIKAMPITLNSHEYIGALSDFTGEIGRMAVASATKRDKNAVLEILQADLIINTFIYDMNFTNKFYKKHDAVLTNLKKVGIVCRFPSAYFGSINAILVDRGYCVRVKSARIRWERAKS